MKTAQVGQIHVFYDESMKLWTFVTISSWKKEYFSVGFKDFTKACEFGRQLWLSIEEERGKEEEKVWL
jgi:hypothetical protein